MNPVHLNLVNTLLAMSAVASARIQLSLFALDLGADASAVSVLYAVQFAFPLLLALPIGRWADRIGSRGLLMLGFSAGAIGMVIPWAVPRLYALYAAGLLSGVAFAFFSVLLLNLMGLLSTPETRSRNFANISLMGAMGNVAGPLVAGFAIDNAGQQIASLCSAAFFVAAFMMLAVWGGVLPGGSGAPQAQSKSSFRELISDRVTLGIILVSCLAQIGNDLFSLYVPIYAHSLGISASTIGTLLSCFFAGAFAARLVVPQLVARFGEPKILICALFIGAGGFGFLPLLVNPVLLGVIAFMFGVGMGASQPVTMALLFSRAPRGRSAETVAFRQTATNLVRVIGPPVFGVIATAAGLWAVFATGAALMGLGGWKMRSELAGTPSGKSEPADKV